MCYLRDLADANRLVNVMQSSAGGNAVVIGGGYIGMECAASLVINKINVTMVFPEAHCSKHSSRRTDQVPNDVHIFVHHGMFLKYKIPYSRTPELQLVFVYCSGPPIYT